MRVLCWHVHGSWSTAFVRGGHRYLLPTRPDGTGGRPRAWDWPDSAVEVELGALRPADVDVAVVQRPEELDELRAVGLDPPVVYLEHNTPRGDPPGTRHPMADRDDLTVVHVTHFNDLMWDCGRTRTVVVPHGIPDPGHRYTGELARAAVVVNEPVRRGRVTGTDLLPRFAAAAPLDVFGMGLDGLGAHLGLRPERLRPIGDLPQPLLHEELARRRVYVHPMRWTSLGLSLLEAMALGMPVVALATTEAVTAVPPGAGVLDTDVDALVAAAAERRADPAAAARMGRAAREAVLESFGLKEFLTRWDRLLMEVTA
ncbi:MAG TPA: glycosyltransferase [Pseudonocardiaceae bacterium]